MIAGTLAGIVNTEDWVEEAHCSSTDPEAFFPEKGGSPREAKRVCAECPVRAECLRYALERNEKHGVWGGLTERERHGLKSVPALKIRCRNNHLLSEVGTFSNGQCRECSRIRGTRRLQRKRAADLRRNRSLSA